MKRHCAVYESLSKLNMNMCPEYLSSFIIVSSSAVTHAEHLKSYSYISQPANRSSFTAIDKPHCVYWSLVPFHCACFIMRSPLGLWGKAPSKVLSGGLTWYQGHRNSLKPIISRKEKEEQETHLRTIAPHCVLEALYHV